MKIRKSTQRFFSYRDHFQVRKKCAHIQPLNIFQLFLSKVVRFLEKLCYSFIQQIVENRPFSCYRQNIGKYRVSDEHLKQLVGIRILVYFGITQVQLEGSMRFVYSSIVYIKGAIRFLTIFTSYFLTVIITRPQRNFTWRDKVREGTILQGAQQNCRNIIFWQTLSPPPACYIRMAPKIRQASEISFLCFENLRILMPDP